MSNLLFLDLYENSKLVTHRRKFFPVLNKIWDAQRVRFELPQTQLFISKRLNKNNTVCGASIGFSLTLVKSTSLESQLLVIIVMFYLPVNSFEDKRQMLCCFAKKNALIDGGGRVVMSIVCFFLIFFFQVNFFDVLLPCILLPALSRPDKSEAVALFDQKRLINLIWKVLFRK